MDQRDVLGAFEQTVLAAVLRLRSGAYGMTIRREITERTGSEVSIGAVYTTLERLEGKGFVSGSLREATAERGGRRKKYFEITNGGRQALENSLQWHESIVAGLLRPLSEARG